MNNPAKRTRGAFGRGTVAALLIATVSACALQPESAPPPPPSPESQNPSPIVARIHFNTQTADFPRARAFYRLLGYTDGVSGFPKTNTYPMARSLGMYDLCTYVIDDIEVMHIPGADGPTAIDLIKFKVPYNDEPPYPTLNRIGMIYAAMATARFDADYRRLREADVRFLSEPVGEVGRRHVFLTDPDGVFYKLEERDGSAPEGAESGVFAMPYIAINVSDLERSIQFYRGQGYVDVEREGRVTLSGADAQAMGFDRPVTRVSARVSIPGGDRHSLRLIRWVAPFDATPPYPAPISHIGMHRLAVAVPDLDAAVAYHRARGVEFLSRIAPCCSGTGDDRTGIINAVDPDGVFVELVGPIQPKPPIPPPENCK